MKFVIVGLGNPGDEYTYTRHNAGRLAVEAYARIRELDEFSENKKLKSLVTKDKVGAHTVTLLLPNTFMNKSGSAVKELVTNAKAAERLVVVYDDIDLPFGTIRLAFGRGSGGHKGIESIVRAVATKNFVRVRIGVAPTTPSGKLKKPQGDKKVLDYLLGEFTKKERTQLEKHYVTTTEALASIVEEGRAKAMNKFN